MNYIKILGIILMSLPFIVILIMSLNNIGLRDTLKAFGLTALIALCIGTGSYLLN